MGATCPQTLSTTALLHPRFSTNPTAHSCPAHIIHPQPWPLALAGSRPSPRCPAPSGDSLGHSSLFQWPPAAAHGSAGLWRHLAGSGRSANADAGPAPHCPQPSPPPPACHLSRLPPCLPSRLLLPLAQASDCQALRGIQALAPESGLRLVSSCSRRPVALARN